MSDLSTRDALAKAIADYNACGYCEGTCAQCRQEADALIASGAVAGVLADERERIAREIEALSEFYSDGWPVHAYEIKASAAGIARDS